ncbi:hypothetical protein G6F59_017676 [Rhizopus arrhizus]|nr:hypothetical protein G6F59_017676 [Rhizopus arrhizus]
MDREYALDLATAVAGDKAHIVMAIRGETYEGIVMVLHSRRTLINAQFAVTGQAGKIRYPHDAAGPVDRVRDARKHANTLQRDNDRELDC